MQTRCRTLFHLWIRSTTLYRAIAFGLLAACLTACGSSSSSNTQLASALQKNLTDYMSSRSSAEHISTLSLSVSFRGQPQAINVAVGTTQYGGGPAVTPSNLFQIGSNTKSFTAVAILQLEAAGVLSIDDTVGKWLPQYPQWSNVTIRQLLNMTSGIPTYDETPAWMADYLNNPMVESTPAQLVAYVYPTLGTPGAAWIYSNTNYILAQMIVDKASSSGSYQTEISRIIVAAGLNNTYYQPYFYPPLLSQRLVSGYYDGDATEFSKLLGKDASGFSLGWAQGAGGMISTPEDLTKWVRALFEGNVLPLKQLQEFTSLVAIPSGQPISQTSASQPQAFGLGVYQATDPTLGRFWLYDGATIGYRATYMYFAQSGVIISIFTNSYTATAKNKLLPELFPSVYATLKASGRIQ